MYTVSCLGAPRDRIGALDLVLPSIKASTSVPRSHENAHTLGPPEGPRRSPTVGSWRVAISYEQDTPVLRGPCSFVHESLYSVQHHLDHEKMHHP